MDRELAFLDDLDVDLGQRRSRDTLALYLKGLRVCEGRRSLANIAAAVCADPGAAIRLIERFNYQLNDRQGRNGRGGWAPAMMRALAERAVQRLSADGPRALLLDAAFAPHLGRSVLAQRDVDAGTAQVVVSVLVVGFGPTGELETQPIGWRLAFDGSYWDDMAFERSDVPHPVRHKDDVAIPAGSVLADLGTWSVPPLPIVASGLFAELRYLWHAAGWSYVVKWKQPRAGATAAAAQHADEPPIETLQQEIEQRDHYWRDVREREPESTNRALTVRRTDLMTKWRTVESKIEIGANVWCAHLPGVPDDETVNQALEYYALRESAGAICRRTLHELGVDDYRGRRFSGWHAHRALVSAAHLINREEIWEQT